MGIGAVALPLVVAGVSAMTKMTKAMTKMAKGGGAPQILEMPAPAPQKEAPDQYNRMREQQRRDRMRRGLAATIRTGGMGDTTLANLSAPSLLGGTQKTLLGQ
jgi:hypothetical protein